MINIYRRLVDWWVDRKLRKSAIQYIACEADRTFEKPSQRLIELRKGLEAKLRRDELSAIRAADPTLAAMLAEAPESGSRMGEYWSNQEECALSAAYRLGATIDQLIKITARTRGAVVARLVQLGHVNKLSSGTLVDRVSGLEVLQ